MLVFRTPTISPTIITATVNIYSPSIMGAVSLRLTPGLLVSQAKPRGFLYVRVQVHHTSPPHLTPHSRRLLVHTAASANLQTLGTVKNNQSQIFSFECYLFAPIKTVSFRSVRLNYSKRSKRSKLWRHPAREKAGKRGYDGKLLSCLAIDSPSTWRLIGISLRNNPTNGDCATFVLLIDF